MKVLLSVCFLLNLPLVLVGATGGRNWYFDFYQGVTVCRVSGVRANESKQTTVIEHGFGRYVDEAFLVDSKVESDSGVLVLSGSTRWEQVGDHFEGRIVAGDVTYRGVLHIQSSQIAILEIFAGTNRMSRSEYRLRHGTLVGRTDIYDTEGKVESSCASECEKKG